MTDYQILVLIIMSIMNTAVAITAAYVGYCLLKFEGFRKHLLQSAQDGDEVTHWVDAKNVVYLILGLFCSWFTTDIAGLFIYSQMFDLAPMAVLSLFIGVSFTLLGIAWKKP
jgi:uncharacterized membrane protein YhdT